MKNSFSLFEIILTILVSSIIFIYSSLYIKELYFTNDSVQKSEIYKIDLLATKSFLQKRENIGDKLKYENEILYFENNVLLKEVSKFKISTTSTYTQIDIEIDNKISQTWKILNE